MHWHCFHNVYQSYKFQANQVTIIKKNRPVAPIRGCKFKIKIMCTIALTAINEFCVEY